MKKKILLIIFCTILVVFVSSMTTLSYLTDEAASSNVYTIGNVKIMLNESNVNELGEIVDGNRKETNYYHLMPGYTYVKDPMITVLRGSSDSYVRILLTVSDINGFKEIYGDNFKLEDIYNEWGENWSYYNQTSNEDGITYEYRYNLVVSAIDKDIELEPLFNSFTIPNEATVQQLELLKDVQVNIVGQAIQVQGFDRVDKAWESFNG